MTSLHRLAIFTGGSSGHDPVYQNSVAELGSALARAGIDVVYGGGRIGLMGQIADSVLAAAEPGRRISSPHPPQRPGVDLAGRGSPGRSQLRGQPWPARKTL